MEEKEIIMDIKGKLLKIVFQECLRIWQDVTFWIISLIDSERLSQDGFLSAPLSNVPAGQNLPVKYSFRK